MNPINTFLRRWQTLPAFVKSLLSLLLLGLLLLTYMAWAYTRMPGAILYVHNHTDRPIFSYAVNDAWGGNALDLPLPNRTPIPR